MASNFLVDDPILGQIDTDDVFITDAWLIDQFVGNQMWNWGGGGNGALGDNTATTKSSPVQIGNLVTWKQISYGLTCGAAIKTDGTLWAWGLNARGQLGDNTVTTRSSPVQIGTDTNWSFVSCNPNYSTFAIRTTGTLWAWGSNDQGQLGLGDLTHRSSPTQVGSLTNWKQVSAGTTSVTAIKTDGTLWAWGYNASGELGLNDNTHRSSPVQVGSLTTWKDSSSGQYITGAIKTDGTLWMWGTATTYGLGDNTVPKKNYSSPVQIGTDTNWKYLSCSSYYNALAIRIDNTLWAWGHNGNGQLGLNDLTHRSSPTQVGSLTNWKYVSAGLYATAAVKTDGTLWVWGHNNSGQLGLNDVTHRSSPVQLGSLTNWKQVSTKSLNTGAITYIEIN